MTLLLLSTLAAHLIAALLVGQQASRYRQWNSRQRSFAILAAWLVPVLGPALVLVALHAVAGPGDPHLKHAAEQLQTDRQDQE
jgi:hypothetical protein